MEFIEKDIYKDKFGIYCIINVITGNVYVGQTKQRFIKRFWHHNWKLSNGTHDNKHLQDSWNFYGSENFEYIILQDITNENLLDDLEIQYIQNHKNIGKSYNIIPGGYHNKKGVPLSEEAKKKIGEKNRVNMLGKKHSEYTKKLMSDKRKGQRYTRYRKTNITDDDTVFKIKTYLVQGMSATEISNKLNVKYNLINNILSNNAWDNITVDGWDEFRANRKTYKRLSKTDHEHIYYLHIKEGYTKYELSEMYNKGVKMIEKILRDQRHNQDI